MTTFASFGFNEPIARALSDAGYTDPTPIQSQSIPVTMAGHDVLGIAQTGTGKTLAFAAPLLHHLSLSHEPAPLRGCTVLVLAPTRELATQIAESFKVYGKHVRPSVLTVFGGVKVGTQIRQLQAGVDVLVATPGRLLDLIDQKALKLDRVKHLVLDEADQMLDLGFIHALRRVVKLVPRDRQTLLFSATMPKAIETLAADFLRDPRKVSVAPPSSVAERVAQSAYRVSQRAKPAMLAHVLKRTEVKNALVFTRTKHGADRVVRQLAANDIEAVAIHGNKSQPQRQRALEAFRSGKVWVLVATDIAARGIDIDGLSHVVNYEIPNVPEQYVHRIGRTGRAGAEGEAISLVADDEKTFIRDIERITRQQIDFLPLPEGLEALAVSVPDPPREERARDGRRPGGNAQGARKQGPRSQNAGGGAGSRAPRKEGAAAPQSRRSGDADGATGGRVVTARPPRRDDDRPQAARGDAARPKAPRAPNRQGQARDGVRTEGPRNDNRARTDRPAGSGPRRQGPASAGRRG